MTSASHVDAEIWADRVPVIPAAREYAAQGLATAGTRANWKFLKDWVDYTADVPQEDQYLLCDAQTSGGLLAAVPAEIAEDVVHQLVEAGTLASAVVGRIAGEGTGRIRVLVLQP
jgi:selenide,water dikinase